MDNNEIPEPKKPTFRLLEGVDLDSINQGKVNQFRYALNRLEVAAEKGCIYKFMEAARDYLAVKDEAEKAMQYGKKGYVGPREGGVSELQRTLLRIFNETAAHGRWRFGPREGDKT